MMVSTDVTIGNFNDRSHHALIRASSRIVNGVMGCSHEHCWLLLCAGKTLRVFLLAQRSKAQRGAVYV